MPAPPYWVLRTPSLSETDLFRAVHLAEEMLEGELFAPLVPRFADPAPGLTGFLDLRGGSPAASLASLKLLERAAADPGSLRLASSVTLLLSATQLSSAPNLDDLRRLGERLLAANPFTLFQLVIEGGEMPPIEPALRLAEAFHRPGNYFDRSRYYQEDLQGRFSSRLYHLTAEPEAARRHFEEPLPFELVLEYTPRLLSADRDLLEEHPLLLLERPPQQQEQREIEEIYAGRADLLIRAPLRPSASAPR